MPRIGDTEVAFKKMKYFACFMKNEEKDILHGWEVFIQPALESH